MEWRQTENEVLTKVFRAGALTTRRVITEHGPKPNWARLLHEGYLREVLTVYGAVLAATPKTHQLNAETQVIPDAPYLSGPTAVADRAYQMDALRLLEAEGYRLARHEYKRSGSVGHQTGHTSQIVRTVLRVPPAYEPGLLIDYGEYGHVRAPRADQWGIHEEVLGYPSLYASIGGGGIKSSRLRSLYRQHWIHIHWWRHPLIVAVPEEGGMRAFLRGLEAERARLDEGHPRPRFPYPLVRLLTLPLP